MTHTRLAVTPSDPARREAVSTALFGAGAGGLLEEGNAFVTVFATDAEASAAEAAARRADASATVTRAGFEPGNYLDAWRVGVRAHVVGRLVIAPPWLAGEHDAARTIVIDPGTGFGTGEHESTRLTLALLQDAVRAGDVVADAGCGSGVLSIAAARLGASRVAAIDSDPEAIANAESNVALNDAGDVVSVVEGDAASLLPLLAPVRVIAANIIASVLGELLPVFDASLAPGGDLVVGGVLVEESAGFAGVASAAGWRVVGDRSEGAWWSAHLRRAGE